MTEQNVKDVKKNNGVCHVIFKTKRKRRDRFKKYCHSQGVTVQQGLNALTREAVKAKFPMRTIVRMS